MKVKERNESTLWNEVGELISWTIIKVNGFVEQEMKLKNKKFFDWMTGATNTAASQFNKPNFLFFSALPNELKEESWLLMALAAPPIIQKFYFWFDGRLFDGWRNGWFVFLSGGGLMAGGPANGSAKKSERRQETNHWIHSNQTKHS